MFSEGIQIFSESGVHNEWKVVNCLNLLPDICIDKFITFNSQLGTIALANDNLTQRRIWVWCWPPQPADKRH